MPPLFDGKAAYEAASRVFKDPFVDVAGGVHLPEGTTCTVSTSVSSVEDKIKRADFAAQIAPFVSQKFILTRIFEFSEEEADQILYERRAEGSEMPGIGGPMAPLSEPDIKTARFLLEQQRRMRDESREKAATDPDMEYFRRNMRDALKVPKEFVEKMPDPIKEKAHEILRDVRVEEGGFLVCHVKTDFVPANKIEDFLRRVKRDVGKIFKDTPVEDRVIYMAGAERYGFSALNFEKRKEQPVASVGTVTYNGSGQLEIETGPVQVKVDGTTIAFRKRKPRPPVMG